MTSEANRILNHLASMPHGNASATRKQVKEIMLQTGGKMLASGHQYDIVAKSLGAGVYRLTLRA